MTALIWIVDDSRTQAAITQHALGDGYRYAAFGDGTSALEALKSSRPALMLLDWVMPGISGDEVCRTVRADPRTHELPIILMTASRLETVDIVCAIESGANDYVAKPFITAELRARVAAVLREHRRAETERATTRYHEEMLGIVGHDLRNPLSAMSMGLELLADEPGLSPTGHHTLRRIVNSTRRMATIIEQLLDVTRARLGAGMPHAPRPSALKAIVANVLDELTLSRRDTKFELFGDDVHGDWDVDRLEQVISNLGSNAAQYGRQGGPVRVELSHTETHAVIAVHNELRDRPIPPEVLETLFDPFKRADAGSDHAGGLGLGLYIVGEIVRAHHGTIDVASGLDGTVFRVALPRDGR